MIEEVSRQSTTLWMYLIMVMIILMTVGAYEICMSSPIGLTQASINGNFGSKAIMKGGLTHTAAVVAMPKLAGVNDFSVTYTNYPTYTTIAGKKRYDGYEVWIDGVGLSSDQSTVRYPYSLPIDDFQPHTGTIHSGEVAVVYFSHPAFGTGYGVNDIWSLDPNFRGPFNDTVAFEHVV